MDCSLPGSSVHGIFQARVLEWVAVASPHSNWGKFLCINLLCFNFWLIIYVNGATNIVTYEIIFLSLILASCLAIAHVSGKNSVNKDQLYVIDRRVIEF